MERELKEAARQRRLRELEEKRCAWSESNQSGGFGRSSSENDVEMLTKEGLLDFFQRSQSPNSPLGRSASARRHRHTMTSIADRDLQGYLEVFGSTGNEFSKFNSLPRSGRPNQRRAAPWMLGQDDNRELGWDRQPVTSPYAETEPISPLARFSSSRLNNNEDPYNNNIKYSSVSEGSTLPPPFCVFQKSAHVPNTILSGHINVNVEKHTLVRGPQAFELPSLNNNSNPMPFVRPEDVFVTDLDLDKPQEKLDIVSVDKMLQKDPKVAMKEKPEPPQKTGIFEKENEELDNSTISSTTCDTPLPLDPSVSNKKPIFYVIDCTETDCSVTLDYSEADLFRAGKIHEQDPSSVSSNLDSPNEQSTSEISEPKAGDATFAMTEEWDTESSGTAEGKQRVESKEMQKNCKKQMHAKNKAAKGGKNIASRVVRTLTSNESQGMRRVVPISKLTRSGSSRRGERQADNVETRQPLRDQSTPARGRSERITRPPRHSSMPPDESKVQRGLSGTASRWTRDSTPRKAKPSAKPLRNIPKPEEKMCRSTMRALAQGQTQASSEKSSPSTPKTTSDLPSFARNTVASTSRTQKELSTPSRSPSSLPRQAKQNKPAVTSSEERPYSAGLRRVQSVKATSRSTYRSEIPPPPATREDQRKTSSFSEKSLQSRDSTTSRSNKPSWK